MNWVAINIGTYRSSAAIMVGGKIAKVHPLGSSSDVCSFPTIAYITEDHHIRVCAEANAWKNYDPSRFLKDFKYDIHQEQLAFLGVSYSDVITTILRSIKVSAEVMIGNQEIENVLLSIPNQYGSSDPRIDILEKAARDAGFVRIEFIKEALASAYHYGLDSINGTSLIYDLGEMLFAPTLVKHFSTGLNILASSGGIEAGGKYIDELLYKELVTTHNIEYSNDDAIQIQQISSVTAMCRDIKEQLSELENVSHPIPINGLGTFNIDRLHFERVVTPLLEKTYEECDSLLRSANIEWKDIKQVVLVGGSSMIPCVYTFFHKYLYEKDAPNISFFHTVSSSGESVDPIYSVCLGSIKYLQSMDRDVYHCSTTDNEQLSNKEKGLKYYVGADSRKNWLVAAQYFYYELLENEDEESYNYIIQIFQTVIDNLRIVEGTLVLEPILDILGEDSVDLLVEYLCRLQERYENLGYNTFVQEIYKLRFWIEIMEIILK